jgi:Flp pilus assembly protein TadG
MQKRFSEKGQALVLITLAIVGLFGFTALTIDGAMIFSDKRHAQNAADTTVMAATLSKIRGQSFDMAARDRAASNGYDNNGTTNIVEVNNPPVDGSYAGNSEYIQVKITSQVKTNFTRIIGRSTITNRVEAVARAVPGYTASMFGGSAIVGLDPTGCKAVFFNGNANMTITGSGIYVNSNCSPNAFYNQSSSPGVLTTPCLQTVGDYQYTFGKVLVGEAGCPRNKVAPIPTPPLPDIDCGSQKATIQTDKTILSPGNWSGAFPPSGVKFLQSGTYCVSGDFQVNGGDTLIGKDVIIYMVSGFVKWNGGATIQIDAPDKGPLAGLLIYLPPTNASVVVVNGNGDSKFVGSIFAPASEVTVLGGGGASGLECQIIGFRVNLSGSSNTKIDFKAQLNYQPSIPPAVELAQ